MVILTSVKQLRKNASDTIIYVSILQRGATAEDMGEVSVLGRPHRVLLSYSLSITMGENNQQLFSAMYGGEGVVQGIISLQK